MGEPKLDFMSVFFDQMRTLIRAEIDDALLQKQTTSTSRIMTTGAFAKERGVTERAVRNWCKLGMPNERNGTHYRVKVAEARVWLEARGK